MSDRIGIFFFLIGVCLMAFFILTIVAGEPVFGYFFFGALAIIAGGVKWWRAPTSPRNPDTEHFRMVKNLSNRGKSKKK
jgi:hypothetical protein